MLNNIDILNHHILIIKNISLYYFTNRTCLILPLYHVFNKYYITTLNYYKYHFNVYIVSLQSLADRETVLWIYIQIKLN